VKPTKQKGKGRKLKRSPTTSSHEESNDDEDFEHTPLKKKSKSEGDAHTSPKMTELHVKLLKNSLKTLRRMLRFATKNFQLYAEGSLLLLLSVNEQTTSGTKEDLIGRIVDCVVGGGALPRCPKCTKGYLRSVENSQGAPSFACPGTHDGKKFHYCDFLCLETGLPRRPWQELTGRDAQMAEFEQKRD